MKNISVLGSTGSIGTQTLDVARKHNVKVSAITANRNVKLLEEQAREFKPLTVAVFDEEAAKGLSIALSDTDITVLSGTEGVLKAAEADCGARGFAGYRGL